MVEMCELGYLCAMGSLVEYCVRDSTSHTHHLMPDSNDDIALPFIPILI